MPEKNGKMRELIALLICIHVIEHLDRLHYNNLMSCNMDALLQQEELNQAAYSLVFLLCKASHKFC
jgi:hypothetical protein